MEEGMEKRLLLSFALSIVVLFFFGWFYSTPSVEPPPPPETVDSVEPPIETGNPLEPEAETITPASAGSEEARALPAPEPEGVQADRVEEAALETDLYVLRFSNQGAVLTSVELRDYVDARGMPLELIDRAAAGITGWPLAISTGDADMDAAIGNALYAVDERAGEVRMEYAAEGLRVTKVFHVDPGSYRVEVDATVLRDGNPVPFSLVWQSNFGEEYSSGVPLARSVGSSIVYLDGTAFERLAVDDVEDPNAVPATAYAGVADRYFMAMFLLPDARPPRVSTAEIAGDEGEPRPALKLEVPHAGGPVSLYIGPQQEQALTAVDPMLASVIDYGFFGVLARPMMFGLVLIHDFVIPNWGWSIVALTVLINLAFFPLGVKQQLSMQKMQKIQPQMRTLQDKYKKLKPNDPRRQEVQTEMMGLYKKHGVNPLGGCLPILLQMPFLIAVFWLLQVAIELRQAPWMLWITDLAAPDPYYVLPVLFGVSMFVQQKMMPTTMDPTQAKIMLIMPVFLTVMFIGSQSGLMLYWLTSNVFRVGQQAMIRKYWAAPEKPKGKPAEPQRPEEKPVIEAEVVDASGSEEDEPRARRKRRRKR